MNHVDLVKLMNDTEKILKDVKELKIKFNKMKKSNHEIDLKELEKINDNIEESIFNLTYIIYTCIQSGLKLLEKDDKNEQIHAKR